MSEDGLIAPHGGELINRMVEGDAGRALADKAQSLPKLELSIRSQSDVEMIAVTGPHDVAPHLRADGHDAVPVQAASKVAGRAHRANRMRT